MTELLKQLAEKYPKKFWINAHDVDTVRPDGEKTHLESFRFGQDSSGHGRTVGIFPTIDFTSDDYDEMAGLLGKVIWAEPVWSMSGKMSWRGYYMVDGRHADSPTQSFDTPLLASAAAFTAIAKEALK